MIKAKALSMALLGLLSLSTSCVHMDVLNDSAPGRLASQPVREYYASFDADDQTRTVLRENGKRIYWTPGDQIGIYKGTVFGLFTAQTTEESLSTVFSGKYNAEVEETAPCWAVYPATKFYSAPSSGSVNVAVGSARQSVVPSSLNGSFVSVAYSEENTFRFFNLCGGLCFSVMHEGITRIDFRALDEVLVSGKASVSIGAGGKPKLGKISSGSSEIEIRPPSGEAVFTPGVRYFIALYPARLTSGYRVTFIGYGGNTYTWTDKTPRTIKSSVIANVGAIDRFVEDSWFIPEKIDLGLPSGIKWANVNYGASSVSQFDRGEVNPSPQDVSSWGPGWRIPTLEEMQELDTYCTWKDSTFQTIDRGRIYTSTINKKKILLQTDPTKEKTAYLTSDSKHLVLSSSYPFKSIGSYDILLETKGGAYIRPVWTIDVESVSIAQSEVSLRPGQSVTLSAVILPDNAVDQRVKWRSNASGIASVSSSGVVTAKGGFGIAKITVATVNGGKKDSCYVTVTPEPVDMGLPSGTKWSPCNIGATASGDYGFFYAWGETAEKSLYNNANYKFKDVNKTSLVPNNDAAYVMWGPEWSMPTAEEFEELKQYCDVYERTVSPDLKGYEVVSRINGNHLFFPKAGCYYEKYLLDGQQALYRTLTYSVYRGTETFDTLLLENYFGSHGPSLAAGIPIRPVARP